MPNITKFTLIFGFDPDNHAWGVEAVGRAGGWSESIWVNAAPNELQRTQLATARASMLGTDCGIIGWRATPYVYSGNKLVPGHANAGLLVRGGAISTNTNSPDDALRVKCYADAIPTSFYLWMHALPDNCIESGQYVPTDVYKDALGFYITQLTGGGLFGPGSQWLGRDPSKISQRVLRVDPVLGQITTQVTLEAVQGQSWIRLRRVYDDANRPIQGTFFCTAITNNPNGTVTYTVQGLPTQTRTTPSGTARVDAIGVSPVSRVVVSSIGERKVGRPTSLRRGRRTKVRR